MSSSGIKSDLKAVGMFNHKVVENDNVIRYSKDFLLECSKSPLVERPAALPPTSVWFGEIVKEVEVENGRKPSNKGSGSDKIVLGPPKMNFASSSLGGLKRPEDGLNGLKKASDMSRENRSPRGPPSALEAGFGRDTKELLASNKMPKVTPKDITGLLSGMNSRSSANRTPMSSLQSRQPSASSGSTTNSRYTPTRSGSTSGLGSGSMSSSIGLDSFSQGRNQRSDAPEWMSYTPETESSLPKDDLGENASKEVFVDDIQAWKARMKEHERREKEKELGVQNKLDNKGTSRADSSSSWRSGPALGKSNMTVDDLRVADEHEGKRIVELSAGRPASFTSEPIPDIDLFFAPGGIDLGKQLDVGSASAFDKFLSQHTSALSIDDFTKKGDGATSKSNKADGGSRFARFFMDDESEPEQSAYSNSNSSNSISNSNSTANAIDSNVTDQISHPIGPERSVAPGKQLSLDQLFQAHHTPTNGHNGPARPALVGHMPSEADILQSMTGPRKPSVSEATLVPASESEDAIGFNMIMAALSKPPSSIDDSVSQPTIQPSTPTTQMPDANEVLVMESKVTEATKPVQNGVSPVLNRRQQRAANGDSAAKAQAAATINTSSTPTIKAAAVTSPSTASTPPTAPIPTTEPAKAAPRAVQIAFGGGIPTSVYRQLSNKSDSNKTTSPLIRSLPVSSNSLNGSNNSPGTINNQGINGSGSPALSNQSAPSPHQFHPQSHLNPLNMNKMSPYNNHDMSGPPPQSPLMDPRMNNMYPNMMPPPPMPGHGMTNEQTMFFNNLSMQQRMAQGGPPPPFGQMSPFGQPMMPNNGPGGDQYSSPLPPHSQHPVDFGNAPQMSHMPPPFVGMSPYGGPPPMHPSMYPMNPVEMMMHRGGPGGPSTPGMGPLPSPGGPPNHFVGGSFHPMMQGHPMAPPSYFPPQGAKMMMTREEFEQQQRRNLQ